MQLGYNLHFACINGFLYGYTLDYTQQAIIMQDEIKALG